MNIKDFAPIPPARLKRMQWKGERAYRVLSQSFSVRWNGELTADRVQYVFGGFSVPRRRRAPGKSEGGDGATVYSLVDLGPRYPRRYRLLLGDEQLITSRSADGVVDQLLYQILTRLQERNEEFLLIHAGSVVTPRGEGVLLPADAGSGKTTLVAGLIRAGFGFLSDEIGVIDHDAGVLRPYPRALNFKKDAEAIFPDLLGRDNGSPFRGNTAYLRAEEIHPNALADPAAVRFVIACRYQEGTATRVTALTPGATVKELWNHTMNLGAHGARALTILVGVARGATGYRLVSGDLQEAVSALIRLTESSTAAF